MKFKVHMQQYVERTTTVEVEATDAGMAAQIAKTDKASGAVWEDGDDAYSVQVYSVDRVHADGSVTNVWEQ